MATRTPTGANEGRLQKKSNGHFPGQNSLKICVQTPKHLPHLDQGWVGDKAQKMNIFFNGNSGLKKKRFLNEYTRYFKK